MTGSPPTIFISYSHEDEAWKDRLVGHLRVLEFEGELEVWDDRRIGAGDEWRARIEQALERATIAILIVSSHFLTSRFIREEELTRILSHRSRRQLVVIPVIAEPCAWQAVGALQGLQARPADGRPLSAGSAHQINADLTALALEIRETTTEGARPLEHGGRPHPGAIVRSRAAIGSWAWVMVPTAVLALLTVVAAFWRVQTHISLDVLTRRVSFVVRGQRPQPLLNQSTAFSELTIERCGIVSLSAAEVRRGEAADRQARPGGSAYSGPVRFLCDDPGAKIALGAPGDTGVPVGVLDRVTAEPGATVVLEVAGKTDPVVTLDVSTRQELSLPIHGPLRIVTELARSEPSALGAGSSLSAYEVRLAASDRMIQVRSGEQGIVLVVRPAAGSGGDLLNAWLPVQSVQFVDEQIGGEITSPLLGSGRLRYPDYPDVPPVVVAEDEFVVMNRATGMVLQRMALQHKAPGLQLTLEGRLAEGAIGRPDPGSAPGARTGVWFDPRLTWLQTVRHGSYGVGVGALALWALSTAWLGHRRWKKPEY